MTLSRGSWETFLLALVPLAAFPALAYALLVGGAPPLAALVAAAALAAGGGIALASLDPAMRESRNRAWLAAVQPTGPAPPSQLRYRMARIALETLGLAALALAAVAVLLHLLRQEAGLQAATWPHPAPALMDPARLADVALPWLAGAGAAVALAAFALLPLVERRRRRTLSAWASAHGWSYSPGPDTGTAHRQPRSHPFDFGTRGKRKARGGLAGALSAERWMPSRRLARDIVGGPLAQGPMAAAAAAGAMDGSGTVAARPLEDGAGGPQARSPPATATPPFLCFEYEYRVEVEHRGAVVNRRRRGRPYRYCVLETLMPVAAPADLAVVKERAGLKLANATGSQDINFESDAFSRQFWVDCEDRRFAYDVLHPRALEVLLAAGPDVGWHWNGVVLTAWIPGRFDPARCAVLVESARRFHALVPRHVRLDAEARTSAQAREEARREAEGLPPTWALPETTPAVPGGLMRWMQGRQERALQRMEAEVRDKEGTEMDARQAVRHAHMKQVLESLRDRRPGSGGGQGQA